jgi:hypothetical protein
LLAGDYKVQFVKPVGTLIVTKGAGTATDSDADPTTGITDKITIDTSLPLGNIGRDNPTIDAGIKGEPQYGSIGDYVFLDKGNDGQQAGDAPIQGVKVYLYNGAGTVKLDSAITDVNGKYLFDSLLTGSYKVKFVAPAGTIAAKQNIGADVSDSDANKLGWSQLINIDTTKPVADTLRNNPQIDAGFVPVGSIGDYVFLDKDNNNVQSAGDTPVAGVKVYLLDNTGKKIDSTVTDGTGKYLFTNVVSGTYTVEFKAPVGTTFVTKDSGPDDKDSDADATGKTAPITIDATQPVGSPARDNRDVDAGLKPVVVPYGSIGDYVWFDANKDGIQGNTEVPVENVKVILYKETTPGVYAKIDSMLTNNFGKYLFDSLLTGNYKVQFIAPVDRTFTTKDNTTDNLDSDAGLNGFSDITNIDTTKPAGTKERDNRDVDAGLIPALGSIEGRTFVDAGKDGQQAGDVILANVKVYLYKETTPGTFVKIDSVLTNSSGTYKFNDLPSGNYKVLFVQPSGKVTTTPNIGPDATDSDASPTDGTTGVYNINNTKPLGDPGRNVVNVDAGYYDLPVGCKETICVPFQILKVQK